MSYQQWIRRTRRRCWGCALGILGALQVFAQAEAPLRVYLIPGTGADQRLFHELDLSNFDTVNVRLPVPDRGASLESYAREAIAPQIDTSQPFALLGVSLGGMIAVELTAQLHPQWTVILASAKTRRELPPSYRIGRVLPAYELVGGKTMRWLTKRAQPRLEPMAPAQRDLFLDMLYGKPPAFIKRAVRMICRWRRTTAPDNVIHVHGQNDRTLPFKHVAPTVAVRGAGHMLVYDRAAAVEWVVHTLTR